MREAEFKNLSFPEVFCSHDPYTNVYSRFIHNSQEQETTQMSFSRWTVNQKWYIYSAIGRDELLIHCNLHESQNIMLWKKVHRERLQTVWFCLCDDTVTDGKNTLMTARYQRCRELGMVRNGQLERAWWCRNCSESWLQWWIQEPMYGSKCMKLNRHLQLWAHEIEKVWMEGWITR